MIKIAKVLINNVQEDSIAQEIGLKKGDLIVTINGEEIVDILDYKFNVSDEYIELEIEHENGEVEIYEIEKDESDDLGIEFVSELIDEPRSCYNNCIFCFMNQLPPHVRKTLIFKDDDYRLSFFTGNYVTLTNVKDNDIDRIIKYRLSPVNISVHATDEKVRCMMLNNRHAGKLLGYIEKLYNASIYMNTQIVLCKGINDGKILEKSLHDLSKFCPFIQSICIVPVGLTKFREDKYPLQPIGKEDSNITIDIVEKYQKEFKKKYGTNLVYLADEFYYKAQRKLPEYKDYEDFPQLENGVGMTAIFDNEFDKVIRRLEKDIVKNPQKYEIEKTVTLITGAITKEYIENKSKAIENLVKGLKINVFAIENKYFGENITVTGLVTGNDIINRVNQEKTNGLDIGYIVIPSVMLKEDKDIFLDDVTLEDLYTKTGEKIVVSDGSAKGFLDAVLLKNSKLKENIYKCKINKNKKNSYEPNEVQ